MDTCVKSLTSALHSFHAVQKGQIAFGEAHSVCVSQRWPLSYDKEGLSPFFAVRVVILGRNICVFEPAIYF